MRAAALKFQKEEMYNYGQPQGLISGHCTKIDDWAVEKETKETRK